MKEAPARVALFVSCLVDLFRPTIGFASLKLLEEAGCEVLVPDGLTCCGQPAYNSGDLRAARSLARRTIEALEPYEHIVIPSGSCAGMLRVHYPELFAADSSWRARAQSLAGRVHELSHFLNVVLDVTLPPVTYEGAVTYHDSCSCRREMGVFSEPRALLAQVRGLTLRELPSSDECCGFGGTFCLKFPEISERMVTGKVAAIATTESTTLLGGNLGCLMNLAGRLRREGRAVRVYHLAEVLAGMTDRPAIGEGRPR